MREGSERGQRSRKAVGLLALLSLAAMSPDAAGQELEPRAYSPSPTGASFLVVGYGRSTGGVVFDPSLPFSDVRAEVNAASLVYGRTFGLAGRLASVDLVLPYVWGSVSGEVAEEQQEVHRSGGADARFRLTLNLVGAPALSPREFATRKPSTILGASLMVAAPTGQYDPAKLINLGANRWAFRPQLGLSHPVGRWNLELYGGVWLFTDNEDFFGGSQRRQQAIGAFQTHVSYTVRRRLWAAVNATFYTGGRTTVDGVAKADLQRNSRVGATLSLPIGQRHSLKLAATTGMTTRIGGDFDSLAIAWQYVWLQRRDGK